MEYNREIKDPLTQRTVEWRDLFNGIPYDCGNIGPDTTSPGVSFVATPPDFDRSEQTVSELVEGNTPVTVTVKLTVATTVPVIVPVSISPTSTAILGDDYDYFSIDLTTTDIIIPAGEISSSFTFDILSDLDWSEGNEIIIFKMGEPSNAIKVDPKEHTVTIVEAVEPHGIEIEVGSTNLASFYIGEGRECYAFSHAGHFFRKSTKPRALCYYDPVDGYLKQTVGGTASIKCGYICSSNEEKKVTMGSFFVDAPAKETTTVTVDIGANKNCVGMTSNIFRSGKHISFSFAYDSNTGMASGTVYGYWRHPTDNPKPSVRFSWLCTEDPGNPGPGIQNLEPYYSTTDAEYDIGTNKTCISFLSYTYWYYYIQGRYCNYDPVAGTATGYYKHQKCGNDKCLQCGYLCGQ